MKKSRWNIPMVVMTERAIIMDTISIYCIFKTIDFVTLYNKQKRKISWFHPNSLIQLSNSNSYTIQFFYRMDDEIIALEYYSASRERHNFSTNRSFVSFYCFFWRGCRVFGKYHCAWCIYISFGYRFFSCWIDNTSFFPMWKRNTSSLGSTEKISYCWSVSIYEESYDYRYTYYFIWGGSVVLVPCSFCLGVHFFGCKHAIFSFRGRKKFT
jgi:hypothetical protein